MIQVKKLGKTKTAVVLINRAAAVFICGAKKEGTDNLLLFQHYFYLVFAKWPVAVVVMGRTAKLWTFFGGVAV